MELFKNLFSGGKGNPAGPIQQESDQPEEDRKLAGHVRSLVEEVRAQASRTAHEGIWMTNIAAILGYDGLSFNTTTRQFQPTNRSSAFIKKNRIHVNKILPTIHNRTAKICKSPPKWDVRPESNDTEDKDAARLALQTLGCLWDELKVNAKRVPLMMWVQECGHAYIKVCWDPSAGKFMTDPVTGESGFEGNVRVDIVSAFEVFPDPLAKDLDEAQWVIHAKVRKLDYFKTQYPKRGHLVREEATWLLSAQYEQRINSLNSRGPSQGGSAESQKNTAIEMIKYEKPTQEYPQGRMIAVANGITLENKELPVGEITFAKFDDIVVGGKYNSEAIVTHLRPIQEQYNETIRRRSEWTKKLLAGKYIAARGSEISQEAMTDETSEIVFYTPVPTAPNGGQPVPMPLPVIPQYAYLEEERLDAMINYISGISDISRGDLPSASIPAIGMQLLLEEDASRIGLMTTQHEHAWAKVGSFILKYVEEYFVLPRKLKIAGKNLQYTIQEITGEALRGNTDVIVVPGSTVPNSKALKRQDIINGYQMGLLGDPADPKVKEKVLADMEFGDTQEVWQDYALDMAQISRGLKLMEQGQPIQISELDNHPLWIQEINRARKSEKFETYPPEVQSLYLSTLEQHVQSMVQLTQPQMPPGPMGMPPQGGGGPSQPQPEDPNSPPSLHQVGSESQGQPTP